MRRHQAIDNQQSNIGVMTLNAARPKCEISTRPLLSSQYDHQSYSIKFRDKVEINPINGGKLKSRGSMHQHNQKMAAGSYQSVKTNGGNLEAFSLTHGTWYIGEGIKRLAAFCVARAALAGRYNYM